MMAGAKALAWVLVLGLTMAMRGDGAHHASAPAPAVDCSSSLLGLTECLTFVEEGSVLRKPKGDCCTGLKNVVKEQVSCLCYAFKQGADYGVKLNMTKALDLPLACGVVAPSIRKCTTVVAGAPVASPDLPSSHRGVPTSSAVAVLSPSPSPGTSDSVKFVPKFAQFFSLTAIFALCSYYLL